MDEYLPVSLNDRCVMLLESVIAENRRLRETIEARDAEQQQPLQLVSAKLDNTANQKKKKKGRSFTTMSCKYIFIPLIATLRVLFLNPESR